MTVWAWAPVGLIISGSTIAFILDRRGSARAQDAKIASNVVTRLVVTAILVWAIVRLTRNHDALHLALASVVGLVAVVSSFLAALGAVSLFSRSES